MLRETRALVESGLFDRIYIAATCGDGLPELERLDEGRLVWRVPLRARHLPSVVGKIFWFGEWYGRLLWRFRRVNVAVVNCHSLSVLPLGILMKWLFGSRVVYDTHELETETVASVGVRRLLARLTERALIHHVVAVVVVSESIANWYRATYGLSNVVVIRNIPESRQAVSRDEASLRQATGIAEDELLFLYEGLLTAGRGVGIVLEAFSQLPSDRHVVFLGEGPMVRDVLEYSRRCSNIHYVPSVPPGALSLYTVGADVGLALVEDLCLSYYLCLPNKLFEYLASGVPVIVSDFPEMAKVVNTSGCGWTCQVNVEAFASLARTLTRDGIKQQAAAAGRAARSFSWEAEATELIRMYEGMGLPSG